MAKILCSTGALMGKANDRDYRLLPDIFSQLECDGLELMIYGVWMDREPERFMDTIGAMGIEIPVIHSEKTIGDAISRGTEEDLADALMRFRRDCLVAERLGVPAMVLHLWGGHASDSAFTRNRDLLSRLYDEAGEKGIDLYIENIVCTQFDPLTRWQELYERYPDIHFVYDTKMAAFHDQESALYAPEYRWLWEEKHVRHYHINDYAGGYKEWEQLKTLPIGMGHVDFETLFSRLNQKGYDGTLTVEATALLRDGTIDTAMLNRCFRFIREHLFLAE